MRVNSEADRHEARRRSLTTRAAAEMIGVSMHHVRHLIADGKLRALDVSRRGAKQRTYRIRPEWVEQYLEENTLGA